MLRPFVTAFMVNQLPISEVVNGLSSDAKCYLWFHVCTAATIMRLCRTGYMLPTCKNGIQLLTSIPLFGFFGKICPMDCQGYDKLIQETFAMHSHPHL